MSVERVIASMEQDFLLNSPTGSSTTASTGRSGVDLADHRRWSWTTQRDALRRRVAPGPDDLAAGDRPAERPAGGLRPGRQQRPTPHAAVPQEPQDSGLSPAVVVTDGSNLYPTTLAKLSPDACHQLCVFHVLKDLHEQVLDAVRRQRRAMSRRGNRGRQRQRGRRPEGRAKRQGLTNKEKSSFVHRHRYLIVKRREKMTRQERIDLATMRATCPS